MVILLPQRENGKFLGHLLVSLPDGDGEEVSGHPRTPPGIRLTGSPVSRKGGQMNQLTVQASDGSFHTGAVESILVTFARALDWPAPRLLDLQ